MNNYPYKNTDLCPTCPLYLYCTNNDSSIDSVFAMDFNSTHLKYSCGSCIICSAPVAASENQLIIFGPDDLYVGEITICLDTLEQIKDKLLLSIIENKLLVEKHSNKIRIQKIHINRISIILFFIKQIVKSLGSDICKNSK